MPLNSKTGNSAETLERARDLDHQDPLASFRERFRLPVGKNGDPQNYLCGNSLGLQPVTTAALVNEELDDWAKFAVEGHFKARRPWMPYHELLTGLTASLVGAQPIEVVNMNTLTVNLHLMMVSFFKPDGPRRKLLIEKGAFPSDRYAVESQLLHHGLDPASDLIEIAPRNGESCVRPDALAAMIEQHGKEIALIMLPGVQYYSGQVFDMQEITRLGHAQGCVVGFDLAHACGNVPLSLHDWDVDFAVWCNYKYLNSGPGAVAGCFVHERHARRPDLVRFSGWWGHDKETRFRMGPDFVPMPGAEGWQLSNPPILSLAPVLASLQLFDEAGMDSLREKSLSLTGLMETLIRQHLDQRVEILTPADPSQRGCQLSLRLRGEHGNRESRRDIFERLLERDVIGDWREPDVIRVAPVPLYNTHEDVWRFVEILGECLA